MHGARRELKWPPCAEQREGRPIRVHGVFAYCLQSTGLSPSVEEEVHHKDWLASGVLGALLWWGARMDACISAPWRGAPSLSPGLIAGLSKRSKGWELPWCGRAWARNK